MYHYFIAEMNTSHFGDISKAKDMILAAKESGADCVKFQSWSANTLYSDEYYNENPVAKRFVKKFSLADEELAKLASFAKYNQIDFSSVPLQRSTQQISTDYNKYPGVQRRLH